MKLLNDKESMVSQRQKGRPVHKSFADSLIFNSFTTSINMF